MRHRVKKTKLNRDDDHRKALARNMARSLILDGKIETTLAKAKFIRPYVEKLVTKAKKDDSIRNVNNLYKKLNSKEASKKLFGEISETYKNRAGGYTRIVKTGFRSGDKAPLARVEWVVDEVKSSGKKAKKESKEVTEQEKEPKTGPAKTEKRPSAKKTTTSEAKKEINQVQTKKEEKVSEVEQGAQND